MRKLVSTVLFMVAAIFVGAATQTPVEADDVSTNILADDIPTESIPEPITGDPVQPLPGSETKQKIPSEPYDIGAPEHAWKLEQLSPAERAAVERGRAYGAARAASGMNAALTLAAKEQSKRARAEAAQHQLGVTAGLGEIGVVP